MKRTRKTADIRRDEIVAAALDVVAEVGLQSATVREIAARAGCSFTLVKHYYATMPQLRRAVIRAAIVRERVDVLAQGLAVRDKHADKAPEDLRRRAAKWLEGGDRV